MHRKTRVVSACRSHRRAAFTILELLITVTVISIVTVVGALNISSSFAHFRTKAGAESLAAAFQLAQGLARCSRSNPSVPVADRPSYAVVILNRQAVNPLGGGASAGFAPAYSFFVGRQNDPAGKTVTIPGAGAVGSLTVDSLAPNQRAALRVLPPDIQIFSNWPSGAGKLSQNAIIRFRSDGTLDETNSTVSVMRQKMKGDTLTVDGSNYYTLDVVGGFTEGTTADGYLRVRFRVNGTVDYSRYMPATQTATNLFNAAFEPI